MDYEKNRRKENQDKLFIANGSLIKDGLISVWVTKEQKQEKHSRRVTWGNIITMGFKMKETNDDNRYLWGKVDELNKQLKELRE
jgi:hypothetical protein